MTIQTYPPHLKIRANLQPNPTSIVTGWLLCVIIVKGGVQDQYKRLEWPQIVAILTSNTASQMPDSRFKKISQIFALTSSISKPIK